jgi:hypothetical protein
LSAEVALRHLHKFRRHPKTLTGARGKGWISGGHETAAGQAKIKRLVIALSAMLEERILARDAPIGSTMGYAGRDITAAHHKQTKPGMAGFEDELSATPGILEGIEARGFQEGQYLVEDPTLIQGEGEHGTSLA